MKTKHDDLAAADEAPQAEQAWAIAQSAPVTDRVNVEPPIFHGMTVSEGKWIAVLGLVVYTVVGGLLFIATGWWQTAAVTVIFGTGATLWFGSTFLAKIKRGRPDGYYVQAIHLWLAAHGMASTAYLLHSDYWSIGNNMPFGGFTSPLIVHEGKLGSLAIGSIMPTIRLKFFTRQPS